MDIFSQKKGPEAVIVSHPRILLYYAHIFWDMYIPLTLIIIIYRDPIYIYILILIPTTFTHQPYIHPPS